MEPSGRNRWQPVANRTAGKSRKEGKTVAVGCDQLPKSLHGKEGVGGSKSARGLCKSAANRRFFRGRRLQDLQYAVRVEPFMEPSG